MAVASKRCVTMAAWCVICSGLAVSSSRADLPPAMDRAPQGAMGLVAIRNISAFHERVSHYAEMFGLESEDSPLEMMDQLLQTPGLNKDGSAMVIISAPQGDSKDQQVVIVAPVTDAKAFASSLNAQGDSIMTADFDGQTVYMKDTGSGYLVMGPTQDMIKSFSLGTGASAGLKEAMGATATRAADRADIVVYMTPALAASGIAESAEKIKDQMSGLAMMAGPQGAPGEMMGKAAEDASQNFARDGQAMVITLAVDDGGAVIDFVTQFKEGTPMARNFQIAGNAGTVSAALPDGGMLLAGAVDTSSPLIKSWLREAKEKHAAQANAGGPLEAMLTSVDKVDGIAMSVGLPPAGLMGGLLTASSTYVKTSDAKGLVAAMKSGIESLDGQSVGESKIKASYKTDGKESESGKFDSWSINVPIDENNPNAIQAQQMEMMLFGGVPAGLVAATDNGVVMTLGNNSKLMAKALDSARSGKGFAAEQRVAAVRSRLPEDRAFEVYVGVKGIIDMVGPFIAMQTGGKPIKSPEALSPIAMGGSMSGGAMGLRLVLPADVLETVGDIMADMKEDADDSKGGDDAPADTDNKPPRF